MCLQLKQGVRQKFNVGEAMNWIVAGMKWIMLVAGLLTCSMLYAAIAPEAALRTTFGDSLEGPVAQVVVRNWGILITLIGAMLIYGAFNVAVRPLVLSVAAVSKLTFIALVLTIGPQFLSYQAGIAVASDILQVVLFIGYLIAGRSLARVAV
jgi:hypothetical protein